MILCLELLFTNSRLVFISHLAINSWPMLIEKLLKIINYKLKIEHRRCG